MRADSIILLERLSVTEQVRRGCLLIAALEIEVPTFRLKMFDACGCKSHSLVHGCCP